MALNGTDSTADTRAAQWENQDPGSQAPRRGGFVLTQVERVLTWARTNSLWPLTFGTSCCAIEMMSVGASRHDWSRFGFEVARATPRQADLIVVAGTITFKMATRLRLLYSQMPDPKWVLAMGACATSGGPFFYESYAVVKGVDRVLRWTSTSRVPPAARGAAAIPDAAPGEDPPGRQLAAPAAAAAVPVRAHADRPREGIQSG